MLQQLSELFSSGKLGSIDGIFSFVNEHIALIRGRHNMKIIASNKIMTIDGTQILITVTFDDGLVSVVIFVEVVVMSC